MEEIQFTVPADFDKQTNIFTRLVLYEAIREDQSEELLKQLADITGKTDDEAKQIFLLSEIIRKDRTEVFIDELENLRYKLYQQLFMSALEMIDHFEVAKEILKQYKAQAK